MKLKRIADNVDFTVDVENADSIYAVKKKLSNIILLNCDEIILIHKNRLLKNDKLINDYSIDKYDFVLFGNEGMNNLQCDKSNNQYEKNYFEKYCVNCFSKLIEPRNDKLNHLNDGKNIRVHFLDEKLFEIYTNGNGRISDALERVLFDLDRCLKCKPYELNFNGQCLYVNNTFADYGIEDGDVIQLIANLRGGATHQHFSYISPISLASPISPISSILIKKFKISSPSIFTKIYWILFGKTHDLNEIISINRNERISDAFKDQLIDSNKCEHCNSFHLYFNEVDLDINKRFVDYDVKHDDIINLCKCVGTVSMKCITGHYDPFQISSAPTLYEISNLINNISDKIKIPQKNIELFLDKNRSKPINSDIDLRKFVTDQSESNIDQRKFVTNQSKSNIHLREFVTNQSKSNIDVHEFHIDIYFNIKPNFDNLVKLEKLGKGSFGTVFKCVSVGTNEEIAVKKLKIPSADDTKEHKLSIKRELQFYNAHLHHPRIVKYERHFQTENEIFIVMEYMKGGSLRSYIDKNGSLSESKIKKFAKQILEALQYFHQEKILHRDIKADNILLDEEDNVKLCDFGLSKNLTDLSTMDLLNGVRQSFVGTANFMAPEIVNDEPYGPSADVWSFGATLVEMVTGFRPYHEMDSCQVIMKIYRSRMIEYNYPDNMSGNLKSFIDSCLQPEPNQRSTIQQLMNHRFIRSL